MNEALRCVLPQSLLGRCSAYTIFQLQATALFRFASIPSSVLHVYSTMYKYQHFQCKIKMKLLRIEMNVMAIHALCPMYNTYAKTNSQLI